MQKWIKIILLFPSLFGHTHIYTTQSPTDRNLDYILLGRTPVNRHWSNRVTSDSGGDSSADLQGSILGPVFSKSSLTTQKQDLKEYLQMTLNWKDCQLL